MFQLVNLFNICLLNILNLFEFNISFFDARSTKKKLTLLYPSLLRKVFIVPLIVRAQREETTILLHLFLLRRLFVAPLVCFCAQREENFYFAVSLVAQTALCCTFFLARTARSNCLLYCDFFV